uniref:Glutamate racemase n=1 Tax=candidate division CPR3 bacterium TaxID=2268181 RepID=A0A7C4R4P8_UNCC3
MNNNPIGIFDSGIGGISVLIEAIKQLPNEDFIYFCDQRNIPYGGKKPKELKRYIDDAIGFLLEKKVKAIVLACNTATSIAAEDLREKYPTKIIIGMEPAIKPALEKNKSGKIIVLATPVTLDQKKFWDLKNKIDKEGEVIILPLDELAGMIDNALMNEGEEEQYLEIIKKYLENAFKKFNLDNVSSVVLGCTHYIFIKNILSEIFPSKTEIIDGNKGTVNNLKKTLSQKGILNEKKEEGKIRFFTSDEKLIEPDIVFKKILRKKIN